MCAMACATSLNRRSASGLRVPPTCLPLRRKRTTATATANATCSRSLASSRINRTPRAFWQRNSSCHGRLYLYDNSRAVFAIERLRAAAVELGDEPHDVEPEAQVRLGARVGVAHRHHRLEEFPGHRFGQARASV